MGSDPESTLSWVISNHRARRCSILCSRLHAAVCATCIPRTTSYRLNINCRCGADSKVFCKASTSTRNPSPVICTTASSGLRLRPTAASVPVKPSLPTMPASAVFPSFITTTREIKHHKVKQTDSTTTTTTPAAEPTKQTDTTTTTTTPAPQVKNQSTTTTTTTPPPQN